MFVFGPTNTNMDICFVFSVYFCNFAQNKKYKGCMNKIILWALMALVMFTQTSCSKEVEDELGPDEAVVCIRNTSDKRLYVVYSSDSPNGTNLLVYEEINANKEKCTLASNAEKTYRFHFDPTSFNRGQMSLWFYLVDADEFDAQFVPYVYKSLLAYYQVTFLDYCIPGKERRWTFTYPQKE